VNKLLNPRQAFFVMQVFLEDYFRVTSSDSVGSLLSCMQFLEDGQTADPALWEDWCKIVGSHSITIMQTFLAMNIFLSLHFQQTSSINIKNILNDISLVINDRRGKEQVWQKWIASVDQILG
jgi:hypothetical protein